MSKSEYYLEFYAVGNSMKVSAVDPLTGTEVSIVGALTANKEHMSKIAIQKLENQLRKLSDKL